MSYSDTYGQVFNVQTLIDHAARRCGKFAEELTSEQLLTARQSLGFVLTNLINIGIQYWAIKKEVVGLTADKYIYALPVGANDVLNALYRTMTRTTGSYTSSAGGVVANVADNDVDTFCQQASPNGNISVNFGTNNPVYAGSIGVLPYVAGGGSATWTFSLQYSTDGSTWNTLEDPGTVVVTDNQWLWYDIDPGQTVQFYRIVASGGTTLALREWYIGNNSREITMARLNRDDYTNLPNKNFTANQPYQFWFNRTIPQPEIYLWPVPSDPFVQMTIWYSKQIMDVGDLTDEVQIPQRWYMATLAMLSHQLSLELPGIPLERIQYLEGQSEKYLMLAEQEERDRSPIYFSVNITPYTA
jgi:lipoprotein-anchoring transpeptidase ErfK/SrfK